MSQFQALIVEDEQALLFLYERVLQSIGWDVLKAKDGEQAIAVLQQHTPHLIFLDMLLPGIHGKQVLEYIVTEEARLRDTHVVIVSASKEFEQLVGVMPAKEFLHKPILADDVRRIGRKVIEASQAGK